MLTISTQSEKANEFRSKYLTLLTASKLPKPQLKLAKQITRSSYSNMEVASSTSVVERMADQDHPGSPRFVELMHALHRITRLQRQACNAQIDARQKRREAEFRRAEVLLRDERFMKELQRLLAGGKLKEFDELHRLAGECQEARDNLGPLEEEGTRAEQRSEGEVWKLQLADQSVHKKFNQELDYIDSYSSGPPSTTSSPYQSGSLDEKNHTAEFENDKVEIPYMTPFSGPSSDFTLADPGPDVFVVQDNEASQDTMLLGVHDMAKLHNDSLEDDVETGHGDIDLPVADWSEGDLVRPPESLQSLHRASLERYPDLITEFGTIRDRINKWILSNLLLSHLEATVLKNQLTYDANTRLSSWAQLVFTYWELDEAATAPKQDADPEKLKQDQQKQHPHAGKTSLLNSNGDPPFGKGSGEFVMRHAQTDHGYLSHLSPQRGEDIANFMVPLRPAPQTPRPKSDTPR
jgi:hypothetical protein